MAFQVAPYAEGILLSFARVGRRAIWDIAYLASSADFHLLSKSRCAPKIRLLEDTPFAKNLVVGGPVVGGLDKVGSAVSGIQK